MRQNNLFSPKHTVDISHLTKKMSSSLFGYFRGIQSSDFAKNIFIFIGGSLLAQVITIGTGPIITRLFTPENFGIFSLFISIVGIMTNFSSLCYGRAILLPREDRDALNVIVLGLFTALTTIAILTVVILVFKGSILSLLKNREFGVWLGVIPAVALLNSYGDILTYWRMRKKNFKTLSMIKILRASVAAGTKILLGFFIGAYAFGLIAGFILSAVVIFFVLFYRPERIGLIKNRSEISFNKIKSLAVQYKNFPLFSTWSVLIIAFSQDIVIYLLMYFFNSAVVGLYSLGVRFIKRPISLVSDAVLRVYFQKAAQDLSEGRDARISLKKITLVLAMTGFLPVAVLGILGGTIFGVVFGQEWVTAGTYAQIMAPWFFMMYITTPANVIFEVYQRQGIKLVLNIMQMIMRFVALFVGFQISKNPLLSLGLFVCVNVIFNAIIIASAFMIAKRKDLKITDVADMPKLVDSNQ